MSPTQLSLELLRKMGWYCCVVEANMRIRKATPEEPNAADLTFKRDMWGFGDICALKKGQTLLVQTTTLGNIQARVNKIRSLVAFEVVKEAGWRIEVHGWADKTYKGGLRVIDLTNEPTDWTSVFKAGPKRRGVPRKQTELRL